MMANTIAIATQFADRAAWPSPKAKNWIRFSLLLEATNRFLSWIR